MHETGNMLNGHLVTCHEYEIEMVSLLYIMAWMYNISIVAVFPRSFLVLCLFLILEYMVLSLQHVSLPNDEVSLVFKPHRQLQFLYVTMH